MTKKKRTLEQVAGKEGQYGKTSTLLDLHVNMSNALVRAAHGLTLVEKRIVAALVARVDSARPGRRPGFDQMTKLKLEASEYAKAYGVTDKNAYRDLKEASDRLFLRYVRIQEKGKKGTVEIKFHWVSGVVYKEGEGTIEMNFTPEVTPHLTYLRKEYTGYRLEKAAALRSVYTWRLFELMQQFAKSKALHITLEDFRRAMDTPKGYRFADIRKRVIEPAIKELDEKNGLLVKWEPRKKGRAVAALSFTWEEDPQRDLFK